MEFINETELMEFVSKMLIRAVSLVCISLSAYFIWFDFTHLLFSQNHAFHIRLFSHSLPLVALSAIIFGLSALKEGKFSGTAAMSFLQNSKVAPGSGK
jgi:hypothetical protein